MRGVTEATGANDADLPLLDDLMPWSVAPLRFGRSWIVAPDPRTLRSRWDRLGGRRGRRKGRPVPAQPGADPGECGGRAAGAADRDRALGP